MRNQGSGGSWGSLILLAIFIYIGCFLLFLWGIALVYRVCSAYHDQRLSSQDRRLFHLSLVCAGGVIILMGILNLVVSASNASVGGVLFGIGFFIGIGTFLAVCKFIELRGRYQARAAAVLPFLQQPNPWWP